jgi:hypothetical protein
LLDIALELLPAIMSVRRFVDKIAVDSEPGLSNAQLMLTNDDLRPGTLLSALSHATKQLT